MKTAKQWFELYGVSHKNPKNIMIHKICVPLIMFSVIGLFYSIPTPESVYVYPWANWATLLIVGGWVFYASLGLKVLAMMIIQSLIMYSGILYMELYANVLLISILIFVLAWIAQFIGHKIEGVKPSFLDDLSFLFIGPAWVMRKLIGYE